MVMLQVLQDLEYWLEHLGSLWKQESAEEKRFQDELYIASNIDHLKHFCKKYMNIHMPWYRKFNRSLLKIRQRASTTVLQ